MPFRELSVIKNQSESLNVEQLDDILVKCLLSGMFMKVQLDISLSITLIRL